MKDNIKDFYPDETLIEITDYDEVVKLINSKASSTWGSGKLGDTGYTSLSNSVGIVLYCENSLVNS